MRLHLKPIQSKILVKLAAAPEAGIADADLARAKLVGADLDGGRATLVHNDFSKASADDKAFVAHMLKVAALIDDLYAQQTGTTTLATQVKDTLSQSLFRRNRGPKCVAPGTDSNPACTAIAGLNKVAFDVYPADIQKADDFCAVLEKRKDAEALLTPFTVVRADGTCELANSALENALGQSRRKLVQGNALHWLQEPGPLQDALQRLPALKPDQLFEITLEPPGGSTIGRPTGPVLYIGRAVPLGT